MTTMLTPMKMNKLLEPTLKSLTNFQLTQNKDSSYMKTVQEVLYDNRLEKIPIHANHSLFGALSVALYLTVEKENQVISDIKQKLLEIFSARNIPLRLYTFKDNRNLLNDFLNKPYHLDYRKYVYDLASLAFDIKLIICTVPSYNHILNESYYSNGKSREVRLLLKQDGEFEPLFGEGYYEKAVMCREIVEDRLDGVLSDKIKDEDDDSKKDNSEYTMSGGRRRHKRSLSDSNFERFFAYARENMENSSTSRVQTTESFSNENEKLNQLEKEFNFFLMMDQKDDLKSEIERKHIPAVGRNLESIFKQEVPTSNLFESRNLSNNLKISQKQLNGLPIPISNPGHAKSNSLSNPAAELDFISLSAQNSTQKPNPQPALQRDLSLTLSSALDPSQGQKMEITPPALMPQIAQNQLNMNFDMGMFQTNFDNNNYQFPFAMNPGMHFPNNGGMMQNPLMNQNQQMRQMGNLMEPVLPKKKPIILDQTNQRYRGRLKFFDEAKGYGFIIMDDDGSDIFCHYDDFFKAGIDMNVLKGAKAGQEVKLSFCCLSYIGRHNKSRKAVDLKLETA